MSVAGDGVRANHHVLTREDIQLAKQIERIVDKAQSAGAQDDYRNGVRYYKEVLKLAPGCDLFFPSNPGQLRGGASCLTLLRADCVRPWLPYGTN